MPTPPRKRPRPTPQPIRRSKVAGHGVRGIRPPTEQQDSTDEAELAQPPAEQPLAEQPTAEQTPAEQPPAEEEVAERPVVEDVVTDHPAAEPPVPEKPRPAPVAAEPVEQPSAPERDGAADTAEPDRREGRKLRLAAICAVLAVVCAGLAVYFVLDTGNTAPPNVALTDAAATKAVQQQVGKDLTAIMSYDYRDPGKTARAAREALGNDELAGDYSDVINVLKRKGPSQQLSLQTRVVKSGVIELRTDGAGGDRAVVLALASQNYSKGGEKGRSQATSARLRVNAKLEGERWRITNIEQY